MESSKWQPQLSTVTERTQYAYKNSLFCDVKFNVFDSANGEKVTIPANKYMLAVSSPVFEAMFYGDLNEKQETIDLPDCTKEGLQELLRFVHSDEVNLTGNNVMEVLYLADKYIMPFLAMKCREYVKECLKPKEVFSILPQVQHLSDEELEEHCWKVIDNNTQLAISSNGFIDISQEMLCQVLTRDSLKIKEVEIFQAVDKWAAKRIKERGLESSGESKRAIIGEKAIRLIRFSLIPQKELAEMVLPYEILENNELIELHQIYGNVSPTARLFNTERRQGAVESAKWTMSRFTEFYPAPLGNYTDNRIDEVNFSVSKATSLFGVRLFGSKGSTNQIELKVLLNGRTLSSVCSLLVSELVNDKYYGFAVTLYKPLNLEPNATYTLLAKISGPSFQHGVNGQCIVHFEDLKIRYGNFKSFGNRTSVSKGQFPSLLLLSENA